ncbi:uncharacterized protein yc1106_00489 [Curvularia clavata]|uniref:Uncharacterized protein n=1 Tax=Curvularia clavata TaxID=95742 RepID=A0A9Q8Z0E2_CURCL|nr:uncharacterized protein yc1106_00489 [Curvularia clavata]
MLFADLLKNFKSTPPTSTFTCTDSRTNNHAITTYPENDWEIITPEEATAFYTDRITLFLGPPRKQRHHIPLADIPESSTLLTYLATLDPAQRYTHIAEIDMPMIVAYLKSLNRSVDALVIEASWLDIIKLAITAEALQDARMEIKALSALREKELVLSP